MLLIALLSALAGTPLTLEDATAIALERAEAMIVAREDLLLVEVAAVEARSAILPRFDLSLSAGEYFAGRRIVESRNPVTVLPPLVLPQVVFGSFRDAETNNYSHPQLALSLTGRQLIYDGGRWWTVLAKVDDQMVAKKAALDAVKNNVRAEVARAFYQLEKARRAIRTFEVQLDLDRMQLDRAQAILQAGRGKRADVAIAQRNLAHDQIQLRDFLRNEAQARRGFNLQLGRSPQERVVLSLPPSVSTTTTALAEAPIASLSDLIERAEKSRPELRDLRAQLEAGRKEIDVAMADHYPTVTLDARYARSSRRPDRILNNPFENYSATVDLSVQWNLYQGGATTAATERAAIALRKTQARLEAEGRRIHSEVEDRREEVLRQREVHSLVLAEIEAAEEAVRHARGLFEAGRGTSLELRDAELGLTQSKLTATNARLDLEIAQADLARAIGTPKH